MKNKEFNYEETFMGVRDKKPETYRLSFRQDYRLRSLIKTLHLTKGNLLDVGCGGGIFTESIPYYFPEAHVYGCDVSTTAIAYARKLGSGKVKYALIKNKKLPYNDNFFDVCICFDVLEHVIDVDLFFVEVKRVLKKNGRFFLIVPCEGQPFTYTWFFQKIGHGQKLTYRYFGHVHPEFTHRSVIELLGRHGFVVKKIAFSEHLFYQLMHLFIYFTPKLLLELFMGKEKTKEYTNSSLISSPKSDINPLITIRKFWFMLFDFMMVYPMYWETVLFTKITPTAWKIHVLAMKR